MNRPLRIGLDVGSVRVKAAQRDRFGRLRRLASFPRLRPAEPVDADETILIAEVLLRQGFHPGPIVMASPPEQVRIEELELPPIKERAALDRVVASELARITHWAPGTFEQQWWPIPAPAQRSSGAALAVASTHASCESLIDPFDAAGFDIEALDLRSAATARACKVGAASGGTKCAVDVGWNTSTLSVWIENELVYVRMLPGSGMRSVARALGLDDSHAPAVLEQLTTASDESPWGPVGLNKAYRSEIRAAGASLAVELERSYTYIARRFADSEAIETFLCGGGANLPGLIESLHNSLGSTVVRATPAALFGPSAAASRWTEDSSLVVACGLMLWNGGGS